MKLGDFDYSLPRDLIAQAPLPRRDGSRLMVLHPDGRLEHRSFRDIVGYLEGRTVYLNDTRVFPARLFMRRRTGGNVEALLVRKLAPTRWKALLNPSRRLKEGETLALANQAPVTIESREGDQWVISFHREPDLERLGHTPLPPYIQRDPDAADRKRYQTVYAAREGSVAAPTAGLHFTEEILAKLDTRRLTLHVGIGTFKPVTAENVTDHRMESEYYEIPEPPDGPVTAVGTTTTRALESWARTGKTSGWTELFMHPPCTFKVVNSLVTNFHLPRSTLLMLVCALAGRDRVLAAYEEAVREGYRFFSYGDAMLIL